MAETLVDGYGSGNRLAILPNGAVPVSGNMSATLTGSINIVGSVAQTNFTEDRHIVSGAIDTSGVVLNTVAISGLTRLSDESGAKLYFTGSPNYTMPVSGTFDVNDFIPSGNMYIVSGADLVGSFTQSNWTEDRYVVSGAMDTSGVITNTVDIIGSAAVTNTVDILGSVAQSNFTEDRYIVSGAINTSGVVLNTVSTSGLTRVADKSGANLYLVGSPNYSLPVSGTFDVNDFIPSGNVYVVSGDNLTGSFNQTNFTEDRYIVSGNFTGSVNIDNWTEDRYIVSGAVTTSGVVTNTVDVIGSAAITNTVDILGSVAQSNFTEDRYIVSGQGLDIYAVSGNLYMVSGNMTGSVAVTNTVDILGSVAQSNFTEDRYVVSGAMDTSGVIINTVSTSGITRLSDESGAKLYFVGSPNYSLPVSGTFDVNDFIPSGNVYIVSGNDLVGSFTQSNFTEDRYIVSGTITNLEDGYLSSGNIVGSVVVTNDVGVAGSVVVNNGYLATSGVITNGYLATSGVITNTVDTVGSVAVTNEVDIVGSVTQTNFTEDRYVVSGHTTIYDKSGADLYLVGSPNYAVPVSGNFGGGGAYQVSGNVFVVSGIFVGSVAVTNEVDMLGSVAVTNHTTDQDDGNIAANQTSQLVINENYGYMSAGGVWNRMPSMAFPTNPGYQTITDGNENLDIVQNSHDPVTGILSFGKELADGTVEEIPIYTRYETAEPWNTFLGVGGVDYLTPERANLNKVDNSGYQYVNALISDGTDQVDFESPFIAAMKDEENTGLFTAAGCYGYAPMASPGTKARPHLILADTAHISPGFEMQSVIPLNYGYNSSANNWFRTQVDTDGNQFAHITDGNEELDIVSPGHPLDTGITAYGWNAQMNAVEPLKLDEGGHLYTNIINPIDEEVQRNASENVRVIETEHQMVHAGKHYFCNTEAMGMLGGNIYWLIEAPQEDYVHLTYKCSVSNYCVLRVYENPAIADIGHNLTENNNDRNSGNTPGMQCYEFPAPTWVGQRIKTHILGTKTGQPKGSVGGLSSRDRELILEPGEYYLFHLEINESDTDAVIEWEWYEA